MSTAQTISGMTYASSLATSLVQQSSGPGASDTAQRRHLTNAIQAKVWPSSIRFEYFTVLHRAGNDVLHDHDSDRVHTIQVLLPEDGSISQHLCL